MSSLQHAFDFLARAEADAAKVLADKSCVAMLGDDSFLKRLVLTRLRSLLGVGEDVTQVEGAKTPWRDVHDELSTLSLFGDGPRVVLVRDADDLVATHRAEVEKFVAQGRRAGCLILDLTSCASNTRLYKGLDQDGVLIECRVPQTKRGSSSFVDEAKVREWLRRWADSQHGFQFQRGADAELVQLVGTELGLLDQELAKLALFCDAGTEASIELVRQVVGGWRAKTTWDLLDAAIDGHAADALLQLERLLQAGEAAQAILGAMLWSLRRFADAAQLVLEAESAGRKVNLATALEQAGFKKWPQGALQRAEKQLRQLGRDRAGRLYGDLLELDLSLKGSHSAPDRARWAIEKMILGLSREAAST